MSGADKRPGFGRGPWCSVCGRETERNIPTFDPRHPIGICSYQNQFGEMVGHGRVPAILDALELADVMRQRSETRWRDKHRQHDPRAPQRGCPFCKRAKRQAVQRGAF